MAAIWSRCSSWLHHGLAAPVKTQHQLEQQLQLVELDARWLQRHVCELLE
jgi:hypothetical protein